MQTKKFSQNNTGGFGQLQMKKIDRETENELEEAFRLFDKYNNEYIDVRELKAILTAFGIEIPKENLNKIFNELKIEPNDNITKEQYFQIIIPHLKDKDSKEEIQRIFDIFDEDKTGQISFDNLYKIAKEVDEYLTDKDIQEMLEEADKDQDGYISFEEFYSIMRKRNNLDDIESDDDVRDYGIQVRSKNKDQFLNNY